MSFSIEEINKRLTRLSNLEVLHAKAKETIVFLENRIRELESRNKDDKDNIEKMRYELEQMNVKIFGKKKTYLFNTKEKVEKEKIERSKESYVRPIPINITSTKYYPICNCLHCNKELIKKEIRVFYEEDIPLPIQKNIIKNEVEVGYCNSCKRISSKVPIPSAKSILGKNIKKIICILSIIERLSQNQIKSHLEGIYKIEISIG